MLIAQLLVSHRKATGLSRRKLAQKIGMDHCALKRFEDGGSLNARDLSKLLTFVFKEKK